MPLHISIVSPERELFAGEADQITMPTQEGEITVLPGHVSLVSLLKAGEVLIKQNGDVIPMVVSGGFAHIEARRVIVLADTAERVEELMLERAQEAYERAQEELSKTHMDAREYAAMAANLERELARLKVARKYRNR
ncbi:MAG: ATP synthase F1 subunit epsilon [bacterium]|nr:ATP synthase F1 subunit epsilon [bacterium]